MNEKYYEEKETYVDCVLAATLAPMKDYESIKYARNHVTGREYIRITDTVGGCAFLDVTAEPLEGILNDVARVILGGQLDASMLPKNIVHDLNERRRIAPLFRARSVA